MGEVFRGHVSARPIDRRVRIYYRNVYLTRQQIRPGPRFAVLTAGVAGDLLVLGTFKYAGFVAANLNAIFSTNLAVECRDLGIIPRDGVAVLRKPTGSPS